MVLSQQELVSRGRELTWHDPLTRVYSLVVISCGVMISGLVSNNSDSEMRELNAQAAEFDLLAWAFSWSEPHVDKRKGQCSNRKLNGPSGSFSTASMQVSHYRM